jgi:purine nucleosidase
MVRLVIDTDPGVDDAHAIMLALAHPDAQVEAITTVAGNMGLPLTTANACHILDAVGPVLSAGEGKDVPVFPGAQAALIARNPHADYVHGNDGLGDASLPASARRVETEHAANALVRLANQAPGELTLVAIGPLTNVALAICLDPSLPSKYKKLALMGGAIHAGGNTTPLAEFNVYSDPEAAEIVLKNWPQVTMVSWETTLAHGFNAEQVDALWAMQTPKAEFFRRTTAKTLGFIEQYLGQRALFEADFLAVAAVIEPGIVRKAENKFVEVELHGQHSRGQTVVDWRGVNGKAPNVELVLELDMARLWELFQMSLK